MAQRVALECEATLVGAGQQTDPNNLPAGRDVSKEGTKLGGRTNGEW
jgi:hypothetical protein